MSKTEQQLHAALISALAERAIADEKIGQLRAAIQSVKGLEAEQAAEKAVQKPADAAVE